MRLWQRHRGLQACIGVASMVLLISLSTCVSSASASYTRPFLRQLAGTPTHVGGLTTDNAGHLWLAEWSLPYGIPHMVVDLPYDLDEFDDEGRMLKSLQVEGHEGVYTEPDGVAIDDATGNFYVAGDSSRNPNDVEFGSPPLELLSESGAFLDKTGEFNKGRVAVDNSDESTTGSVYVTSHNGHSGYLVKYNQAGAPANFSASGTAGYVSGNKINGPSGNGGSSLEPTAVTVDSHGDIFVANSDEGEFEVREYSGAGLYMRSFTGDESPGLNGEHVSGGFGGEVTAVAVDPASDHLIVGLAREGVGAIDEFDIRTGRFLTQIREAGAGESLKGVTAVAVNTAGDLYAVSNSVETVTGASGKAETIQKSAVLQWGTGLFDPDTRSAGVSEATAAGATLHGAVNPNALVNPERAGLSLCQFEYVSKAAYRSTGFADLSSGGTAPCSPEASAIPADESFHAVQAQIAGLTSGETYFYRLTATTSGALGGTASSEVLAFTAPHAPRIDGSSAANVSSAFADLHAQIDPLGAQTSYRFEYVVAAGYALNAADPYAGGGVAPVSPAAIGAGGAGGDADASVAQQIGGLTASTEYHFRVVAENERGVAEGPDMTFMTLPKSVEGLPDSRGYELLTPANKGSAEDLFVLEGNNKKFSGVDWGYPAESGEGFMLLTNVSFGPFPAPGGNVYVFARKAMSRGWSYTSLADPSLGVQSVQVGALEPREFANVGINDLVGSTASSAGVFDTSLVGASGGPYSTLHRDPGGHAVEGAEAEPTHIVGSSRDLHTVVLESTDHSLQTVAGGLDKGAPALYGSSGGEECTAASANCALLNVNNAGKLLSACGAVLGWGGYAGVQGNAHGAVSADGSQVIFTAPSPWMSAVEGGPGGTGCWNGAGTNTPQVYVSSEGATIEVSAPQAGVTDPSGRHPAVYAGASEDGSRIFFLSEAELTRSDKGNHDEELYEWRAEGTGECAEAKGCLVRVSAGEPAAAAGHVYAVTAVAADGAAVYFLANGALAAGAPAGDCTPAGGSCGLYRYDTATGATTYIATVDGLDNPNSFAPIWATNTVMPEFAGGDLLLPAANWYTTPDGRYLLFSSKAELTGYSTTEAASQDCEGIDTQGLGNGHCSEVYRYDASSGQLSCLSCDPSGAAPASDAFFEPRSLSHFPTDGGAVPAMSNDGSYAFFETADALVPQDTNGTLDVYEWHDGRVSLISSGQDSAPSYFEGESAARIGGAHVEAANVFFGTHSKLVLQDTDTAGDLYDARIEGGFPPPAVETGLCEGDACQNPPPPPIAATPGSLDFVGSGNLGSQGSVGSSGRASGKQTKSRRAMALKACRRRPRPMRRRCEANARRRYAKAARRAGRSASRNGKGGRR